jgi:KaiC/GvpD/RAD55 family RecA-like ATPase
MPGKEEFRLGRNYCLAVEDQAEAVRFAKRVLGSHAGTQCIVITSSHPKKLAEDYGLTQAEVIWVTDEPSKELRSIQPSRMKFELTKDLLGFVSTKEKGMVFLEGIEYLILVNGFEAVLAFVKQIADKTAARGHTLLVSINARSVPEQQYVVFKGRFDRAGEAKGFRMPGEEDSDIPHIPLPMPRGDQSVRDISGATGTERADAGGSPQAPPPSPPPPPSSPSVPPHPSGREPTGVDGLDAVIEGGFPHGSSVLLQAPSGVERDMFSAQFACEGLRRGQCVAVTVSMISVADLRERFRSLGVEPEQYEKAGTLKLIDWFSHKNERILGIEERGAVFRVSRGLTNLEIALSKVTRAFAGKQTRLMLDVLTPAITAQGFESANKFAEVVRAKLSKAGITALFTVDKQTHEAEQLATLQQVFDGVVDIEREKVGTKVERKLAVVTMKGTFFESEYLPLAVARGRGVFIAGAEPALPAEAAAPALPPERPARPERLRPPPPPPPKPEEPAPEEAPAETVPPEEEEAPATPLAEPPQEERRAPVAAPTARTAAIPSVPARIARPRPKTRKRTKSGLLAGVLVAALTIGGLAGMIVLGPKPAGDPIDGDLGDWTGVTIYEEPKESGVAGPADILGYAVMKEEGRWRFAVTVNGGLFSAPSETQTIFIFVDSDGVSSGTPTGYERRDVGAEYMVSVVGWDSSVAAAALSKFEGSDQGNISAFKPDISVKAAAMGDSVEIAVSDTALAIANEVKARWWVATATSNSGDESMANADLRGSPLMAVSQRSLASPGSISAPTQALEISATAIGDDVTVSDFGISSEGSITGAPQSQAIPAGTSFTFSATVDPSGVMPGASLNASITDPAHPQTSNNALVTLWGTGFSTYSQSAPPQVVIDGAFGDWAAEPNEAVDPAGDAPADVDLKKVKTSENVAAGVGFYASVAGKAMAGGLPIGSPAKPAGGGGGGGPAILPRKGGEDALFVYVDSDADALTGYQVAGIGADHQVELTGFAGKIRGGTVYRWVQGAWDSFSNPFAGDARGGEIEVGVSSSDLPTSANWSAYFEMTSWTDDGDEGPVVALKEALAAMPSSSAPAFGWEGSTDWQTGAGSETRISASAAADVDMDGVAELVTGGTYLEEVAPRGRQSFAWAYHPGKRVIFLHGGHMGISGNSETFLFEPVMKVWTRIVVPNSPQRMHHRLAYEPQTNSIILFGGCSFTSCTSGQMRNDTWRFTFDPPTWTEIFPAESPSKRHRFGMTYDSTNRRILLFGGCVLQSCTAVTGMASDTWEFDGSDWNNLTPSNPPSPRSDFGLAHRSADGLTYLFGGQLAAGADNELWSFDYPNNKWSKRAPGGAVPSPRTGSDLAYDELDDKFYLYGGYNGAGGYFSDTNRLDPAAGVDGSWSGLPILLGPGALGFHRMSWNPASGDVVLFGGYSATLGNQVDRTWQLDAASPAWNEAPVNPMPGARYLGEATSDTKTKRIVLHGGVFNSVMRDLTWEYDGARDQWLKVQVTGSPPTAYYHAMAYNTRNNKSYLFAGAQNGSFDNELWQYDGVVKQWSRLITGGTTPPNVWLHAMAYDEAANKLVVHGGCTSSCGAAGLTLDTFVYDFSSGNWEKKFPTSNPGKRHGHKMAYSPHLRKVVLFGGHDGNNHLDSTWTYDHPTNNWTNLWPAVRPPARFHFGMISDPVSGRVVAHGGNGAASYSDTWSFNSATNNWTQHFPVQLPPPSLEFGLARDPSTGRMIRIQGLGNDGILNSIWAYDIVTNNWTQISAIEKAEVRIHSIASPPTQEHAIRWHAFGGSRIGGVAVADLDRNGRPDILVAGGARAPDSYRRGEFTVLHVSAGILAPERQGAVSYEASNDSEFTALATVDIGRDGVLEAVAVGNGGLWFNGAPITAAWIQSWNWIGGGPLSTTPQFSFLSSGHSATARGVTIGDLNADGDPEVIVAGHFGGNGELGYVRSFSTAGASLAYLAQHTWNDYPQGQIGDYLDMAQDAAGNLHVITYRVNTNDVLYGMHDGDRWRFEVIEGVVGSVFVGEGGSIAVAPGGTVHMSYYNRTGNSLRYATGSLGSWTRTTVQNLGGVAATRYTSIALDMSGRPHISFNNVSAGIVTTEHATPRTGGACTAAGWACSILEPTIHTGRSSIQVVGDSTVHVAYYDSSSLDLRYRSSTDGGTTWSAFTMVDGGVPAVGNNPSMVVGRDGTIHITYYDGSAGANRLKYASKTLTGGWITETVGNGAWAGVANGLFSSLALDSSGMPSAAVYISTGTDLGFARRVGSGGNCGTGNVWHCRILDSGSAPVGNDLALVIDGQDRPKIAYKNTSGGVSSMHFSNSRDLGTATPWEITTVGTSVRPNGVIALDDDIDGVMEVDVVGYFNDETRDSAFNRILTRTVNAFGSEGSFFWNSPESVADAIAADDIDNDGRPELVIVGRNRFGSGWRGEISIVYREGGSNYVEVRTHWSNGTDTRSRTVALADFDRDGFVEIAASGEHSNSPSWAHIAVVRYHGAVVPAPDLRLEKWLSQDDPESGADGVILWDVALADLDLDGRQNMIAVGEKVGSGMPQAVVFVFSWDGTTLKKHTLAYTPQGLGGLSLFGVAAGDVDHDGTSEVVAVGRSSSPLGPSSSYIGVWNLTGLTTDPPAPESEATWDSAPDNNSEAHDVALGDLDSDGHREVVVVGTNTSASFPAYQNGVMSLFDAAPGTLTLLAHDPFAFGRSALFGVAVADVDRDGVLEAVAAGQYRDGVCDPNGCPMVITQSWGGGGWAFDDGYGLDAYGYGSFARVNVADVDRDGLLESVCVGDVFDDGIVLVTGWTPFGSTEALTTGRLNSLPTHPRDVALGDVDRDGMPDVVIGGWLDDSGTRESFLSVQHWDDQISAPFLNHTWLNDTSSTVQGVGIGDLEPDGVFEIVSVGYSVPPSGLPFGSLGIWSPGVPEVSDPALLLAPAFAAATLAVFSQRLRGRSDRRGRGMGAGPRPFDEGH